LRTASERVVAYLLRDGAVDAPPVRGDGGPCTVLLPASKGTIASLLSVTPEHFSRILHDLQSRGLIAVNRRQIHIPDMQRLACHA
jgi:CRP-like cAMP-binding protein